MGILLTYLKMSKVTNFRPKEIEPPSEKVETFNLLVNPTFDETVNEQENNGLYLNNVYLPEEVITLILSYVPAHDLLKSSEVCKKWCNIIKSQPFWFELYKRKFNKKPKKLPWYVYYCLFTTDYFNTNLIKNGNGEDGFAHWEIVYNYGDEFKIENPPAGAEPLPLDVPEFHNKTSCFATSFYECNKYQEVSFQKSNIMKVIFDNHKPTIYMSEWISARFDCGCVYKLWGKLFGPRDDKKKIPCGRRGRGWNSLPDEDNVDDEFLAAENVNTRIEQWSKPVWTKVDLTLKDYPKGVRIIRFQHEGKDTQFWKGHYGSKMAGGVVKILFDTLEP